MPFEVIDSGAMVQYIGNVFVPQLITPKAVAVEGDLVANYVCCPALTVKNGSLIAPYIDCPTLHADILGVFDLNHVYTSPQHWTYQWLRPCRLPLPMESEWSSLMSIQRVIDVFRDPAIVRRPAEIAKLMVRLEARPSCGRARVLFHVAVEELMDDPDALTPLGRQIGALFLSQPRLPRHWRY